MKTKNIFAAIGVALVYVSFYLIGCNLRQQDPSVIGYALAVFLGLCARNLILRFNGPRQAFILRTYRNERTLQEEEEEGPSLLELVALSKLLDECEVENQLERTIKEFIERQKKLGRASTNE